MEEKTLKSILDIIDVIDDDGPDTEREFVLSGFVRDLVREVRRLKSIAEGEE